MNFANPNTLPASLEYVIIGAGAYLKNFSIFTLNLSNFDKVSGWVEASCANALAIPEKIRRSVRILALFKLGQIVR